MGIDMKQEIIKRNLKGESSKVTKEYIGAWHDPRGTQGKAL